MTTTKMTLMIDSCEHSGDSDAALAQLLVLGARFQRVLVWQCEDAEVAFANITCADGGVSLRAALQKDEYDVSIAHSTEHHAQDLADQTDEEHRAEYSNNDDEDMW